MRQLKLPLDPFLSLCNKWRNEKIVKNDLGHWNFESQDFKISFIKIVMNFGYENGRFEWPLDEIFNSIKLLYSIIKKLCLTSNFL